MKPLKDKICNFSSSLGCVEKTVWLIKATNKADAISLQLNRFNYRVPCNIAFSTELRHIVVFVRSQPTKETHCSTWMSRDKSTLKCGLSKFRISVICVLCILFSSEFNEKELLYTGFISLLIQMVSTSWILRSQTYLTTWQVSQKLLLINGYGRGTIKLRYIFIKINKN